MRAFIMSRAVARRAAIIARSPRALAVVGGVVAGVLVQAAGHQFVALFGSSLPIATGFALAIGLGVSIAASRASRFERETASLPRQRGERAPEILRAAHPLFALALWSLAFPWLAAAAFAVTGRLPMELLATRGFDLFHGVATAVALIAPPVAWSLAFVLRWARLLAVREGWNQTDAAAARWGLAGAAGGILLQVFALAPFVGVAGGAWLAAGTSLCLFVAIAFRRKSSRITPGDVDSPASPPSRDDVAADRRSPHEAAGRGVLPLIASIVVLGAMAALFGRAVRQLMPPASYVIWTEWAAVLLGLAIGCWWSERNALRERGRMRAAIGAGLAAACCAAAFPVLFSYLTDWQLALNASVQNVTVLLLARSGIAVACFLPIGVAWGAAARGLSADDGNDRSGGAFDPRPFLFVAGLLACEWLLLPRFAAGSLFAACGWILAATCAAIVVRTGGVRRPGWRTAAFASAAAVALVAGTMGHRGYDPARSAKILFSTDAVVAYRQGVEPELRTVLDDGRLLAVVEGESGTYTVWRHRGCQLQVRESGMPKAIATVDARLAPQPWSEVLHGVVPMTLHPRPDRVLLLGLGAGATVTTTLAFPVAELVCCETDSTLIALARRELRGGFRSKLLAGGSAWDDERMRVVRIDPKLAVAGRGERFDVILSNADRPLSCDAQGAYTREFYARTAAKLNAGGIFCQRFSHPDYGPLPMRVAAGTLRSAFDHVAFVEVAPGEMLLLATNAPEGFSTAGFGDRLQGPHVRRALAELDWDWTVPLSFTVLEGDLLDRFADAPAAGINTAANGRFAFSLPQEVMRWGRKGAELEERLAGVLKPGEHPRQLFDWIPLDDQPIARGRWEQVLERQRILDQHPDEWWAYRLSLRRRIQQSRPLEIIQARGGDPNEPTEAERRMDYLRALGRARDSLSRTKSAPPAILAAVGTPAALVAPLVKAAVSDRDSLPWEEIDRVAAFAIPYDPLVTHFLHLELAELHGRGDESHAAAQLTHRLHAIHHAVPGDRSVRNIAAAVALLCDGEAEPDPVLRADHLNALLHAFRQRWDRRADRPPKQKAEPALADADACIVAIERAFAALDELSAEGAAADDWPARRAYLERSLLRPLRTYRGRLHQHHVHNVQRTKRLLEVRE